MKILAICMFFSTCMTLLLSLKSKKSFQIHICPGTTIGVFNIPPVALHDPRALQHSLSPHNKDSSGLCHPHKALLLSPPSCRPLKLMSRLCHFSQWAGLVFSSLPDLRVVLCCFSTDCVSLICHTSLRSDSDRCCVTFPAHTPSHPQQQDRLPLSLNCFGLFLHCLRQFRVSQIGCNSNLSDC